MARICVYPGSFDPVTLGHLDVIRRASSLFDQVIVAVLHNPNKTGCFTAQERMRLIRKALGDQPGVTVDAWDGLLVDYVRSVNACAVVRGLRGTGDLESEMNMAEVNARLMPGMETVFLASKPAHVCVSSSVVREAAAFGADLSAFVPAEIVQDITEHFRQNRR